MLIGLTNPLNSFQFVIYNLFTNIQKLVKVQTDTLIHSANTDKHLQYYSHVLKPLKKYNPYIKLHDSKFLQTKVVFLGHTIDE